MLQKRMVLLMDEEEHEQLRSIAARRGESVASVVRQAIRAVIAAEAVTSEQREAAVAFFCQEHDPEFAWREAKRDLEERHGR